MQSTLALSGAWISSAKGALLVQQVRDCKNCRCPRQRTFLPPSSGGGSVGDLGPVALQEATSEILLCPLKKMESSQGRPCAFPYET
jgi:hypothetical protein